MTTSKAQRPQRRLVQLLFLASASTASIISIGDTSLSLSNFQLITGLSIPLGCLLAYNNPIRGCRPTDFAAGTTCSATCRNGLGQVQENLQETCESVRVQTNTLLGQALAGNLVNLLCPLADQPPAPSAAPPPLTPSKTTRVVLPSSSSVNIPPPPPPPPPPSTTPNDVPGGGTTTTARIPPPSTQVPPASQPPSPSPSSSPSPSPSPPPPPPPPDSTAIATTTTTPTSESAARSTSAETSKPPVNPLDSLLMSGGSERTIEVSGFMMYSMCLFSAVVAAWRA